MWIGAARREDKLTISFPVGKSASRPLMAFCLGPHGGVSSGVLRGHYANVSVDDTGARGIRYCGSLVCSLAIPARQALAQAANLPSPPQQLASGAAHAPDSPVVLKKAQMAAGHGLLSDIPAGTG